MRIRWKAIALAVAATAIAAEPSAAQPFAYVLQPGVSFCGIRNIAPCLPHLWTIDIENGRIIHREEGPLGSGWRGPLALTGTGRLLAWSGGLVDRAQMNLQALSGDPEQSVHAGPQVNRLFALIPSTQILRVVDVGGEAFDISLNAAGASGVAVNQDGSTVYVGRDGGVSIVDLATQGVTGSIPLDGTATPSLLLSPDDAQLYTVRTSAGMNTLYRITRSSGAITATRAVGSNVTLAFSPNGSRLWISDSAQSAARIRAIDPATLADVGTVPLPVTHSIAGPVAETVDSARLIVTASAPETVYVIDIATTNVVHTFDLSTTGNPFPLSGLALVRPGDVCNYRVTPDIATVGADGAGVVISVPAPAGCSWSATARSPATGGGWIELMPAGGTGASSISATVRPNRNSNGRTGFVSAALQTVTLTQEALPTAAGAPLAPTTLSAFAQSGRIVELAWTPAATGPPPTHFIIEAGTVTGDRDFISVPVGLLTAVSGGPLPIGGYWVRVRGANASGIGPASREAYFSFPPLPVLDDFRAFWWEATHVTLQWGGPGGLSAVFVEAGRSPGVTEVTVPLPTTAGEFRIPNSQVPPGVYYLRVRAENITGMGPASNEIRFSGVCEAPPPALFDFFARYEAGQVFVSTYIYSTQFLDHFRLFVGRSSGNAEVGIFQTYTRFVHGVLPPVRPYVRAQTVNACGAGPMSVERVVDVP